ncbi:YceI family protein [Amycolatopsis sp. FDAARGOS 1241]|uniref:YceI family protein n=1 Tax=Amycolatopsis sp. FDAARGOS 1241 TaxID=2778070 RepID=UPI00194FFCE0|nr:YceI family protein [Amycolatopsis sp. FDAARGOS 1241]QRP43674.1 YceI family protein [Amycolatopsis sp. FDAARGOS 1241]
MSTPTTTRLRPGTWTVRTGWTSAAFTVRKLGFHLVHGTIPVRAATVHVNSAGTPATVRAELDLTAIRTGITRRDRDLQSATWLGCSANRLMTFTAADIRTTPDGWEAHGLVALRGTSCPLTLTVTRPGAPTRASVRVQAHATLDRAPLGMRAPRAVVGRYVEITIDAVLVAPPAG